MSRPVQPFMTNILTTTIVMYWTAFVYHFLLASEISMLGTSIPLVMEFAKSHDMHPLLLGMIWILRKRKALRLSIGSPHRRLFVRIFRGARFGAYGRMPHRRGVPCSAFTGPVLLAADRP
jgi:hypothetical protein